MDLKTAPCITYGELQAWSLVTGIRPNQQEINLLRSLDRIYRRGVPSD